MADEENLTPMMVQYRGIKEKYKTEVVFFRLGDFYEMFDEDAVEVSRLLNLTLTHRAGRPMCGIPYHAAKIYIARLLRLGKKIVICEQVGEIPKGGKGIAERKVVEIITPGTAVEAEYLDGCRANYLAAMCITKGKAGFAFIDVTTSSFRATSWPAAKMAENFGKELNRAAPRELLLPVSLKNNEIIKSVIAMVQFLSPGIRTGIFLQSFPTKNLPLSLRLQTLRLMAWKRIALSWCLQASSLIILKRLQMQHFLISVLSVYTATMNFLLWMILPAATLKLFLICGRVAASIHF